MKRSLESRLVDLNERISTLEAQTQGDDSPEDTALLVALSRERSDIDDALRDARLIDDAPFDSDAIEVGDLVTIQDDEGTTDRYVLVDEGVGSRARSNWVSVSSPLGAAILGRGTGERIEVESPQGQTAYLVLSFERASEEADIFPHEARREGFARDLPAEAFLG